MNVHIIRDEYCPLAVYQNVFEKLSKSAGVIRFIKSKDDNLVADDTDDMYDEKERKWYLFIGSLSLSSNISSVSSATKLSSFDLIKCMTPKDLLNFSNTF